jgi:hypothetical protein
MLTCARCATVVAGLVAATFGFASPARAATIDVTNTAQLQSAVIAAHDGDVIRAAPGIYAPTRTLSVTQKNLVVQANGAPGSVTILGSAVTDFPADLFAVQAGASLTLTDLTVKQTAPEGFALNVFGTANVTYSTIAGNSGVAVYAEVGTSVSLLNSTIAANGDTGVVADGDVSLENVTITDNTLDGINNLGGGAVTLDNSIVYHNGQSDCGVAVAVTHASLDGDGSCHVMLTADPKLGPLVANGGPTPTRALAPTSPAVDTGDNTRCPPDDQRHSPRNDGKCDIGSYELAQTVDTTPPVITVPPDITAEATGAGGAAVSYTVTATDPDDPVASLICTPTSGTTFPLGTTTVHCTATDTHGNSATASFAVNVVDTTPPVLAGVPSDIVVGNGTPAGAVVNYKSPTATDLVDGSVPVSCLPSSGSFFPLGGTEVTCTATDAHGNSGSASFHVTVTVEDTTPPMITVPADFTVEATSSAGAAVTYTVTFSDPDDPVATSGCDPASGSTMPLGATTIDCEATDSHGNHASAFFVATVVDTTPPSIAVPGNVTVSTSNPDGATVGYAVSANDLVDGSRPVSCAPAAGSMFPIGTTTVACTAADLHGNTGTKSFPVTVNLSIPVIDTTPPTITVSDVAVEATGPSGAQVPYTATFSDPDDAVASAGCTPVSGSVFPLGTTIVTCTANDEHGNTSTATFKVEVKDTTFPAFDHPPADITVQSTSADGAVVNYDAPTATDVVDGPVPVLCTPPSGSMFDVGATGVVCKAVDAHGNTAYAGFVVTVASPPDTTAPTMIAPGRVTVKTHSRKGAIVRYVVRVSDPDDAIADFHCDYGSGSFFRVGWTPEHCYATDSHGNASSAAIDIHVVYVPDRTAPAMTVPKTITVEARSTRGATVRFVVRARDPDDEVKQLVCTPPSGSTFAVGWTTVHCAALDSHGNRSRASFRVRVERAAQQTRR